MIQRTREVIKEVRKEKSFTRRSASPSTNTTSCEIGARVAGPTDHRFELSFNLRDALWLATMLNVFQRTPTS